MLEFQNIKTFLQGYTPNWSEEIFVVSKIKNAVPWTYIINDLNGEGLLDVFMKKNYKIVKKNLE